MASVNVALKGPSRVEVQARLEQIAREADVNMSPLHATASFTAGAPVSNYDMTTALHAPPLTDQELRTRLEPFEDEIADPTFAVRFVVL